LVIGEQGNLIAASMQIFCYGLKNMAITPAQCQAARALLDWTQGELAERAGVELRTVHHVETGRAHLPMTAATITRALTDAGVVFLPDTPEYAHGVALKPGVDATRKDDGKRKKRGASKDGSSQAAWDDATREAVIAYWQNNAKWGELSDESRGVISTHLFGRDDAADEVFGAQT
jgi:DNA-binding XRE family transcriptional regulator